MWRVVRFMNEKTDKKVRIADINERVETGLMLWRQSRRTIIDAGLNPITAADQISISMNKVSFNNRVTGTRTELSCELQQGSLIGVVGSQGTGKTTIMQLLGLVFTPEDGNIFIPPHLRVLHVSECVYARNDFRPLQSRGFYR